MKGDRPDVQPGGRYAPKQTSEVLGISTRTLQRLALSGQIRRRYTVDGNPVYTGKDILNYWERKYKLLPL